jgi:hypothetical protein
MQDHVSNIGPQNLRPARASVASQRATWLRSAIIVLLMIFPLQVPAQAPKTIGDVALDVPRGWSAVREGGTVKLSPRELPAGSTCVIILRPTETLSGDFSAWFDDKWHSVLKIGTKVLQSSRPKHKASTDSDQDSIFASAVVQTLQQKQVWLLLFGIRTGRRAFPILWIASSQQLLGQYEPAVMQVVGSLQLKATTAEGRVAPSTGDSTSVDASTGRTNASGNSAVPPDTPPQPDQLSGVYAGFFMGHGFGSSGFEMNAFVFYPDGTAMYLPEKGLDGYSLAAHIRAGLDGLMYGTYEYHQDGRLTYTAHNGVGRDMIVDASASEPGLKFARVCDCNGTFFDGTYYWGSKLKTLKLLPDGRFIDRGAMQDAFEYSFPNQPGLTNPGEGTYRIANYTIFLNYSDGRKVRHSFVVAARPPKTPLSMWLRGYLLHLVKGNTAGGN